MVEAPSPKEASRRKIKNHIESYTASFGKEDSLKRTVNSITKGHGCNEIQEVFDAYEESWRANPDLDEERLDKVKTEISTTCRIDGDS